MFGGHSGLTTGTGQSRAVARPLRTPCSRRLGLDKAVIKWLPPLPPTPRLEERGVAKKGATLLSPTRSRGALLCVAPGSQGSNPSKRWFMKGLDEGRLRSTEVARLFSFPPFPVYGEERRCSPYTEEIAPRIRGKCAAENGRLMLKKLVGRQRSRSRPPD